MLERPSGDNRGPAGTAGADTIFALSSGRPPAGIAIIRISGRLARFGLETIAGGVPEPRKAVLRALRRGDGALLDRGLVLFWPGPDSFTGEDVAELHLHGGMAVVAAVLAALAEIPGMRPAEAGEFTRRAFLNERLDLTEAEGLADLVGAQTEVQRRAAIARSEGAIGRICEDWRARIMRARALVEAEIDFGEEEALGSWSAESAALIAGVASEVARELARRDGEIAREGAEIVIAGPPNAGKSTLLNALARREVAIVSEEAGTTRDALEVRLDIGGYPVLLVDTAGLRDSESAVEREGVRRAQGRIEGADLVLALADATGPSPAVSSGDHILRIGTKADRLDSDQKRVLRAAFDHLISAVTEEGLAGLVADIADRLRTSIPVAEPAVISRPRHRAALSQCLQALEEAQRADEPELAAEALRVAASSIGRITGRVGVEDMLDVVFREFCIGK